ncbi:MAG: ImmA/IrrE family metallo-endopeptidase [Candidatus Marinimicrobia bacterium]|nr:ImmA/IrrE family metallo-endopeptidase [Candidatus Neomarinimicrobiota bacterium]
MTYGEELAKQHGFKLKYKALDNGTVAYTVKKTIFVNDLLPEVRQNFGIAHEIAHHMLGHFEKGNITSEMELEADDEAAEMLLPQYELSRLRNLHSIKERFPHVSYEVIAKQLAKRGYQFAIFDNRKLTDASREPVSRVIRRVARKSFDERRDIREDEMKAYYVPPNGVWERVIVVW